MSVVDQILTHKLVGIIRLDNYDRALEVAGALVAGGVPILEFTLTGAGALEAVAATRRALGERACVGIGSVLHADQARDALAAGAQFLVTPAVRPAVVAVGVNGGAPVLCGAFTPTELLAAHEAGAAFVKVFPAQLGGPRYIKDVLAPLPFLKLVPTGGVSPENIRAYLDAGAAALGLGGNLVPKAAVAAGAFEQITAAAQACAAAAR